LLDVFQHFQIVLVRLNDKTLVPALVQMTLPAAASMLAPAPYVRRADPRHERRQVLIPPWPQQQMPVIVHQTIAHDPHPHTLSSPLHQLYKRRKPPRLAKNPHSAIPPIEHVIHQPTGRHSSSSWHGLQSSALARWLSIRWDVPLFAFPILLNFC